MQYLPLVGTNLVDNLQDIEADGAVDRFGALVFKSGRLGLLIHGEARAAVERVDLLVEAESAQWLRALDAVVHLVEDVRARARALALHEGSLVGCQRVHL